jgi:hypothetical protein
VWTHNFQWRNTQHFSQHIANSIVLAIAVFSMGELIMTDHNSTNIILEILTAVGTIAVAILAIWGDWFRDKFAAPKLELRLRDRRGNLTTSNGRKVLYYHLVVENNRKWSLAKGVQIMINAIWRKAADGTFKPEILAAEIPLTWAFPQFSPINPTFRHKKICNLGYLAQDGSHFEPSLYFYPNNFKGFVRAGDSVRLGIGINAENFTSTKSLLVEISWDGKWDTDLNQMERHLVVKEVSP